MEINPTVFHLSKQFECLTLSYIQFYHIQLHTYPTTKNKIYSSRFCCKCNKILRGKLDALAEVFINKIAVYRDVSTETVIRDFGQGDVFVGKKAIWQGLANRQSSFERILTDLNKERENENMNEMEIRQQERQRMKEVFDNAEAQGREQIANKMLVTTDLSSSQIIEILKDMPKQQVVSSFEKVMAQIPNPEIVVSGTETAENVEVMAKRIASLANKSSSGE